MYSSDCLSLYLFLQTGSVTTLTRFVTSLTASLMPRLLFADGSENCCLGRTIPTFEEEVYTHFQEAGAHDRKVGSEKTRDGILKMSGHQFRGPVAHSSGTSFEAQCQCVVLETKTAAPQIKTVTALVNKAEEDSKGDCFLTMRMLGNKISLPGCAIDFDSMREKDTIGYLAVPGRKRKKQLQNINCLLM